jgi:putative tricarboxylic transport membrane protein
VRLQRADFFLGLGAIALAGAWLYLASGIQESMLSDATGAAGVPKALGWLMAALGLLLCVRSVSFAAAAPAQDDESPRAQLRRHWQALVLLVMLIGYVVLAPYLGYILSIALLVAATAAFGGAAIDRTMLLIAAGAGVGMWLVFDKLLGIQLPVSALLERF